VYDSKKQALIERKRQVKQIYQGNVYQLYGQYICMKEMGYPVEELFVHSLVDNKRYPIPLPGEREMDEFRSVLELMRETTPESLMDHACSRCSKHIYSPLSWKDDVC
jgi:CRISPR-associated exonuclease Cas4